MTGSYSLESWSRGGREGGNGSLLEKEEEEGEGRRGLGGRERGGEVIVVVVVFTGMETAGTTDSRGNTI